uniref:Si:ch211-153b23.5 n=1 Tax=Salmo trutta TaxID=8032 RepID=A0A674D026_SALTR
MHVVNHCEVKPIAEKRNVLEESAHIARGDVSDLAKQEVTAFDALVIPGDGSTLQVMCCIAPVLAAKALPGCEITMGQDKECERWPYAKTATSMKELGCKHVNKKVGEVHIDVKNKLVTSSAFMCNAPIHEVFDRVGVMVTELLKLV